MLHGEFLDNSAHLYGMSRKDVESDESLRNRIINFILERDWESKAEAAKWLAEHMGIQPSKEGGQRNGSTEQLSQTADAG